MSILTRSGDLVYTFRFLKLLVTKFEDTNAFKHGIIDKDGNRIKEKKLETGDEKSSFTAFHRLVFNIKKLIAKVPGGSSKLATYAAALFLIKEKYSISDRNMQKALKYSELEVTDLMNESSEWFLLENKMLSPGIYKVRNAKIINSTCEEIVRPKDEIKVESNTFPSGDVFGIDVYEATHVRSNQKVYVTVGELVR